MVDNANPPDWLRERHGKPARLPDGVRPDASSQGTKSSLGTAARGSRVQYKTALAPGNLATFGKHTQVRSYVHWTAAVLASNPDGLRRESKPSQDYKQRRQAFESRATVMVSRQRTAGSYREPNEQVAQQAERALRVQADRSQLSRTDAVDGKEPKKSAQRETCAPLTDNVKKRVEPSQQHLEEEHMRRGPEEASRQELEARHTREYLLNMVRDGEQVRSTLESYLAKRAEQMVSAARKAAERKKQKEREAAEREGLAQAEKESRLREAIERGFDRDEKKSVQQLILEVEDMLAKRKRKELLEKEDAERRALETMNELMRQWAYQATETVHRKGAEACLRRHEECNRGQASQLPADRMANADRTLPGANAPTPRQEDRSEIGRKSWPGSPAGQSSSLSCSRVAEPDTLSSPGYPSSLSSYDFTSEKTEQHDGNEEEWVTTCSETEKERLRVKPLSNEGRKPKCNSRISSRLLGLLVSCCYDYLRRRKGERAPCRNTRVVLVRGEMKAAKDEPRVGGTLASVKTVHSKRQQDRTSVRSTHAAKEARHSYEADTYETTDTFLSRITGPSHPLRGGRGEVPCRGAEDTNRQQGQTRPTFNTTRTESHRVPLITMVDDGFKAEVEALRALLRVPLQPAAEFLRGPYKTGPEPHHFLQVPVSSGSSSYAPRRQKIGDNPVGHRWCRALAGLPHALDQGTPHPLDLKLNPNSCKGTTILGDKVADACWMTWSRRMRVHDPRTPSPPGIMRPVRAQPAAQVTTSASWCS
ncbi:hypothetical protein BESB_058900 [Besnoitia besnoiti]|uniref:Uncharacterized protein n=1 Tax=Besnoitia besnoiti TaxID=94643 RepID=A0A2A9MH70_BESBE|nr:hypothetical protein BESB_058900 [Besnoitia besnoiti]PFH35003.1 hypothetical protein BESB_058900 [Besnoitia besnoiti]